MHYIYYALSVIILSSHIFAQQDIKQKISLELVDKKIDSLKSVQTSLQSQLELTEHRIKLLNNIKTQLRIDEYDGSNFYANTVLYAHMKVEGKIIFKIPKNTKVKVLDFDEDGFKISYKNRIGHVSWIDIEENIKTKALRQKYKNEVENRNRKEKEKWAKVKEKQKRIESNPAWIKVFSGNVREKPNKKSRIQQKLDQGEQVFIQSYKNDWAKVFIKTARHPARKYPIEEWYGEGWIHNSILSLKHIDKLTSWDKEIIAEKMKDKSRRNLFVTKNPNIKYLFKQAVLAGQIMLGMSKDMVEASWGKPYDINRTVATWGVREQWIYGISPARTYVYFENGILTSWQD